MPVFTATYKDHKTGRAKVFARLADNYRQACAFFPRWMYPDGQPHRRIGAPSQKGNGQHEPIENA